MLVVSMGTASATPPTAPVSTGAEPAGSCGKFADEQAPAPIASTTANIMAGGRHIAARTSLGRARAGVPGRSRRSVHRIPDSSIISGRCHNTARDGKAVGKK
jgi:hypothetical protein